MLSRRLLTFLVTCLLLGVCADVQAQCFRRGDVNADGRVDTDDDAWLTAFLFLGLPTLPCMDAADVNDDGLVMISDSIYLQSYINNIGPPPPAPGPCDCGPDPTPDFLNCATFACAFLRGDVDQDGVVGPLDATFLQNFLFASGQMPRCLDAADANDDGMLGVSDVVLIQNGGPFPYPFPECGLDLTPDQLDCNCYICPQNLTQFIRGDVDGDGALDPLDIAALNAILFSGGISICDDAADVNDDGMIDQADVVSLGSAVFSWAPIPAPSPHSCGVDPTPDLLGCATPTTCNCLPIDFLRGDCNADNLIDIADVINSLCIVFLPIGTCTSSCRDACDVNDDGCLDVSDPIRMLNYLFGGGIPLAQPFPSCGYDPTPRDNLGCSVYSGCPAVP